MTHQRICRKLYREIYREELPHSSWQRDMQLRGWQFFEPVQHSQSIEVVRQNVARIEATKRVQEESNPETTSNVGYIVLMHSIINGPGLYSNDRYAHMAPSD